MGSEARQAGHRGGSEALDDGDRGRGDGRRIDVVKGREVAAGAVARRPRHLDEHPRGIVHLEADHALRIGRELGWNERREAARVGSVANVDRHPGERLVDDIGHLIRHGDLGCRRLGRRLSLADASPRVRRAVGRVGHRARRVTAHVARAHRVAHAGDDVRLNIADGVAPAPLVDDTPVAQSGSSSSRSLLPRARQSPSRVVRCVASDPTMTEQATTDAMASVRATCAIRNTTTKTPKTRRRPRASHPRSSR